MDDYSAFTGRKFRITGRNWSPYSSNIEYLDVSQVSNFSYFFNNCISLTDVGNIKKWNTSKAIDMSYMFSGTNISKLDLGEWDTSKVINMNEMFYSPTI